MQTQASLQIGNKSSKQIIIRKMKHIGQIDKQIRRNWKHLFKFMNQERIKNPEHSLSPSPHRRILTECTETHIQRQNSNPKKLNAIHSELKRKKVQERQRKNQEIFFKKRTYDVQSLAKQNRKDRSSEEKAALLKRNSVQLQCRKSVEVPFMLRKRTAKVEKEMGIIKHGYKDSLDSIYKKQQLKSSLNMQERQQLVNRIKGSKVYYQFLKDWRSDQQETI